MMRPGRRFLFDLALELGKTVGDIERSMWSAEVAEWHGYFLLREDERRERHLRDTLEDDALAGIEKIKQRKR